MWTCPGSCTDSWSVPFGCYDHNGPRTWLLEARSRGYAFLLAVPAVFASGLYELATSIRGPKSYGPKETALATLVSFGVGLAVISFLMKFISKRSFLPFAIYRLLLGGKLLALLSKGIVR